MTPDERDEALDRLRWYPCSDFVMDWYHSCTHLLYEHRHWLAPGVADVLEGALRELNRMERERRRSLAVELGLGGLAPRAWQPWEEQREVTA